MHINGPIGWPIAKGEKSLRVDKLSLNKDKYSIEKNISQYWDKLSLLGTERDTYIPGESYSHCVKKKKPTKQCLSSELKNKDYEKDKLVNGS
jgi:hypothetical protein